MAVRSSSTSTNVLANVITGTAPSGYASGDRLLAWIAQDVAGGVHSGPSGEGWTQLTAQGAIDTTTDGQTVSIWEKKVATGSETFAFTSDYNNRGIIQIVALTGRHATDSAIISTPTVQNTGQASPASIALTGLTALSGDDLIWCAQADQQAGTDVWSFGSLSTFTNLENASNSDWISSAIFKKENVSAGATGTLTATATRTTGSSNTGWSGVVVAIPSSGATASDPAASSSRFNKSRHTFGTRR